MVRKYDIPSQVEDYDELESKYTKEEIVAMCDSYLRSRERAKLTRATQKVGQDELKEFRAFKAQQAANGR